MNGRTCTSLEPGQLIQIKGYLTSGKSREDLKDKIVMYLGECGDLGLPQIELLIDEKIEKLYYPNLSYKLISP